MAPEDPSEVPIPPSLDEGANIKTAEEFERLYPKGSPPPLISATASVRLLQGTKVDALAFAAQLVGDPATSVMAIVGITGAQIRWHLTAWTPEQEATVVRALALLLAAVVHPPPPAPSPAEPSGSAG